MMKTTIKDNKVVQIEDSREQEASLILMAERDLIAVIAKVKRVSSKQPHLKTQVTKLSSSLDTLQRTRKDIEVDIKRTNQESKNRASAMAGAWGGKR